MKLAILNTLRGLGTMMWQFVISFPFYSEKIRAHIRKIESELEKLIQEPRLLIGGHDLSIGTLFSGSTLLTLGVIPWIVLIWLFVVQACAESYIIFLLSTSWIYNWLQEAPIATSWLFLLKYISTNVASTFLELLQTIQTKLSNAM